MLLAKAEKDSAAIRVLLWLYGVVMINLSQSETR